MDAIIALILSIALEVGVPPHFALAIAFEENRTLNPNAIAYNYNPDGSIRTIDRGLFQLNSSSFPNVNWRCAETNARTAIEYMLWLYQQPNITMWSQVAVAYNGGITRYNEGRIPLSSINYAVRVMNRWHQLNAIEHAKHVTLYS